MATAMDILGRAGLAGLLLASSGGPVPARADDRSVTIIEGMPEPATPAPPLPMPGPPPAPLRTTNPAGVRLDLAPGAVLSVGTDVLFKVSTQKPGYLVLVDINADKAVTQIYPNVMSLTHGQGAKAAGNLIKAGGSVTIPDPRNPLARFVFRTEPPLGRGIIVALLSEAPVQLIDLPDLLPAPATPQDAVDALDHAVRQLLVATADRPGKFAAGSWSFAAVEYTVK